MTSPFVTHLDWDSEFFGVSIARSDINDETIESVVQDAAAQHVQCLYLFLSVEQPFALADALRRGGRLVDLRVEFDLATPVVPPDGIRLADRNEIPMLLPHARTLADASRFSADPRFAGDAVRRMYEIWLGRCFDEGIVVVPAQGFGGFVGARTSGDTSSIDLVYVDSPARGQGLAAKLVTGAVAGTGKPRSQVATQAANIAAQRLYQSIGFRTTSTKAIVHLWIDNAAL
jgi:ribosomal protein S18 acetylase RimI-like enzyme